MMFCVGEDDDSPVVYWPGFFQDGLSVEVNAFRAICMGNAMAQGLHFMETVEKVGVVDAAYGWYQHLMASHAEDEHDIDKYFAQIMVGFMEIIFATYNGMIEAIKQQHMGDTPENNEKVIELMPGMNFLPIPSHFANIHRFMERVRVEMIEEGKMLQSMSDQQKEN